MQKYILRVAIFIFNNYVSKTLGYKFFVCKICKRNDSHHPSFTGTLVTIDFFTKVVHYLNSVYLSPIPLSSLGYMPSFPLCSLLLRFCLSICPNLNPLHIYLLNRTYRF